MIPASISTKLSSNRCSIHLRISFGESREPGGGPFLFFLDEISLRRHRDRTFPIFFPPNVRYAMYRFMTFPNISVLATRQAC
jgi:hypothetical protein